MLIQGSKTGLGAERNAAAERETQQLSSKPLKRTASTFRFKGILLFSISLENIIKISFMVFIVEEKLREQPTSFAGSSSAPP